MKRYEDNPDGKTSSNLALHRGMYVQLRARYGLPSQLACSVERRVAATYKGLWTNLKKNAEQRKARITRKRFKRLDKPPSYSSPTVHYTYQRDYTFKCDQQVSLTTLDGRMNVSYQGYDKQVAPIHHGATIGDAKLWYDKPEHCFYLLVAFQMEVPDPTFESHKEVAGVDVGIRYLAVASTSTGKAAFHAGKRIRHTASHDIAKQLVEQHPGALIGLEQLADIRTRTR